MDGDAFSTVQGQNLRLYGADAPELNQQGWQRDITPVAIGQEAKAIADGLVDFNEEIRTLRGSSYNRPVVPVTGPAGDVGQDLIRPCNALAAPRYLKGDGLLKSYMEAERLARQNRLGLHGVYAQTPEQYRSDPAYLPDRETVAQFWDMPTPQRGLRPEIEQGYSAILKSGSARDILAYAAANRFTIDPADIEKFVAARNGNKPISFAWGYGEAPKPLTDLGNGATGAAARGFGDGVLPNMLDEVGAVPDSLGLTPGRENVFNSNRRWADIWANNTNQNRAIIGNDELAHPYARLGGELAGGVVLPLGSGARTVPQLAKVGAAYGGVVAFAAGETLSDRLTGAVVNAGAGAAITASGGKLLEGGIGAYRALRGVGRAGGDVAGDVAPNMARGAPETPQALPEGVPPPPPGFAVDQPSAVGRADHPAMAMEEDPMPSMSAELRQRDYLDLGATRARPLLRDTTEAERRAATAGIEPGDITPIKSNEIGSIEEAAAIERGRYAEAKAPNENKALTRRTVRNWQGEPVLRSAPSLWLASCACVVACASIAANWLTWASITAPAVVWSLLNRKRALARW